MYTSLNSDQSFDEVLKDYQVKLKKYLIHLLPFTEENTINDLLQDILIKVYRNKDKIFHKSKELDFNTNAYIYQIARNYVRDYIRKWKKQERTLVDPYPINIENFSSEKKEYKNFLVNFGWSPEEENILRNKTYECLYYQINRLKFEYREIIYLYYFENNSLQEIANKLNINIGAASMRLQRARYRLKKILQTTCCIINSGNKFYLSCKDNVSCKDNS